MLWFGVGVLVSFRFPCSLPPACPAAVFGHDGYGGAFDVRWHFGFHGMSSFEILERSLIIIL